MTPLEYIRTDLNGTQIFHDLKLSIIDILASMPGAQDGGTASPQLQQMQKMVGELTGCFKILLSSRI